MTVLAVVVTVTTVLRMDEFFIRFWVREGDEFREKLKITYDEVGDKYFRSMHHLNDVVAVVCKWSRLITTVYNSSTFADQPSLE